MNRIAIDIDEVLCPFFRPMVKRIGKTPPTKPHPYVYRKALDITEEESRKMVRDFYKSDEFKNLRPIRHADYVLYQLKGKEYSLYAVTGRHDEVRKDTEQWLDKFFPYAFEDLVMTNSFTDKEIPKSDVCLSLGIDTIIDDNFDTCLDCMHHGMEAIHFVGDPLYPWCHLTHPNIIRSSDWLEVLSDFPSSGASKSLSDSFYIFPIDQ